jgi:adenine-specific DNA-methyltransferase
MSRLTDLIREVKDKDPALGAELEREYRTLAGRRAFGLNFERHRPEAVELPSRPVRRGDKVRILSARGSTDRGDQRLWRVTRIEKADNERLGHLEPLATDDREPATAPADDLVVVAEFRDPIHPGLVSSGGVHRGGDKPAHTVINGENFHVLKALTYTHRGQVDAIYIDPPYNTGARDWKYNNDYVEGDDLYRHSKWLAFMERRLLLAKELLNPENSVLIVTIDEKEYLRLGLLLEQTFPDGRIQMVSTLVNPANVPRAAFGRSDEYLFLVMQGDAAPQRVRLSREWVSGRGRTHTGNIRWDLLRRSGPGATRADSPGCFYPIYVEPSGPMVAEVGEALPAGVHEAEHRDGCVAVLPIRRDGSEGRWQWTPSTLRNRMEQGRVRITGSESRGFTVSILKDGEYGKVQRGEFEVIGNNPDGSIIVGDVDTSTVLAVPGSQWRISSHDSTQYGSRLLTEFLPGRAFPFPKSLYAVEDALRFFASDKPEAVVLDFFAGSGTTAHAVMRLNRQDGGRRQCISVTNNEVSADEHRRLGEAGLRPGDPEWEALGICDHITKPRIEAAITGRTPDGESINGDYRFTDEFPMAEGFEENAEFFTLTYENPVSIGHNRAFERIAPLLWLRAGAIGRRISAVPERGWEVADTYAILFDLDEACAYVQAVEKGDHVRLAYVVTDDDRRFQSVARQLPDKVEAVRVYESYLSNFRFTGVDP